MYISHIYLFCFNVVMLNIISLICAYLSYRINGIEKTDKRQEDNFLPFFFFFYYTTTTTSTDG